MRKPSFLSYLLNPNPHYPLRTSPDSHQAPSHEPPAKRIRTSPTQDRLDIGGSNARLDLDSFIRANGAIASQHILSLPNLENSSPKAQAQDLPEEDPDIFLRPEDISQESTHFIPIEDEAINATIRLLQARIDTSTNPGTHTTEEPRARIDSRANNGSPIPEEPRPPKATVPAQLLGAFVANFHLQERFNAWFNTPPASHKTSGSNLQLQDRSQPQGSTDAFTNVRTPSPFQPSSPPEASRNWRGLYHPELRQEAMELRKAGIPAKEICKTLNQRTDLLQVGQFISPSLIYSWTKDLRKSLHSFHSINLNK